MKKTRHLTRLTRQVARLALGLGDGFPFVSHNNISLPERILRKNTISANKRNSRDFESIDDRTFTDVPFIPRDFQLPE